MRLEKLRKRLEEIKNEKVINFFEYDKVAQEIRLERTFTEETPEGYIFLERITTVDKVFNVYQKGLEILGRNFTVNVTINFIFSITNYCKWVKEKEKEDGFVLETKKGLKVIVKDNELQIFSILEIVPSKYLDIKNILKKHGLTLHIFTEAKYNTLINTEFKEVK